MDRATLTPKRLLTLAVMYGGRSAEHEISIITALQAMKAIDTQVYEILPVYVAPSGKWYTGDKLFDSSIYTRLGSHLCDLQEVSLLPDPSLQGLWKVGSELSSKSLLSIDACFLAFHGQQGEDGAIQGLLELADIAYTGCGVSSSAIAMNKYMCKGFLQSLGIPVLPSALIRRREAMRDLAAARHKIVSTPGLEKFPLFVKPCHLGSSIGVGIAKDFDELDGALAKVFRYDDEAIIEPCITSIMEINVAVLDGKETRVSVVEIPIAGDQVLTFEDKYLRPGGKKTGESQGMAGLTRVIDPHDLDPLIRDKVQSYALKAFLALGCSGAGRFDFMCDLSSGELYFNELNPIPGSLAFYLWEKSHPQLLYTDLISQMIERALARKADKLALEYQVEFRALKR